MASKIKKHLVPKRIDLNSNQMAPRPEWQEICQSLSKDYKLPRLRELAEEFQVDTEGKTKRQLCVEIAKIVDTTCTNHENLGLTTISSLDPDVYTLNENGHQYCFDRSDYDGYIRANEKNPYTRTNISEEDLRQMRDKYGEQLLPVLGPYDGPRILNYNDFPEDYEDNQQQYFERTGNLSFVYQNDMKLLDNYSQNLPSVMINGVFNANQLIQNCFINSIKVRVPLNVISELVKHFTEHPDMSLRYQLYAIRDYVPVIGRLERGWSEADGYEQITNCIKFAIDYSENAVDLLDLLGYTDDNFNIIQDFSQSDIILFNYIHDYIYYSDQSAEDLAQKIYEEPWLGRHEMVEYVNNLSEDTIAAIYHSLKENQYN